MLLKIKHFILAFRERQRPAQRSAGWALALLCALLWSPGAAAQTEQELRTLKALASERALLTAELQQYQKTLSILQTDGTPPEESGNAAVRTLAGEVVRLKERLVAIAEQEVTLLQKEISKSRSRETAVAAAVEAQRATARAAIESKPLRDIYEGYSREHEAADVERLHQLLENYHAEIQESSATLPTEDELAARELAARELAIRDAQTLSRIPFNADKVRLTGAEGSTALSEITRRLMDPRIPESRRDISYICAIRTRLFGNLVGSESRSLTPVGKNHYVARIRLQPGDTTLTVLDDRWELRLPQHTSGKDFLVTFYRPPVGEPELHVFAVDDLLAQERPYVPAWLPGELNIHQRPG